MNKIWQKYSSPINIPKTGHELVTCHYPLRIDTYSSCYHDCAYCYAKSLLGNRKLWNPLNIRVANINEIQKKIERYLSRKSDSILAKAIKNRVPARLGGLTDCFQPIEREEKVTINLIRYLNSIDYPYLIVTKSDMIGEPDYLKELRRDLAYIQMTITTLNTETAIRLEPNAPSPDKRIKALEKLVEAGFFTAGRISPVIPNITDEDCFEVIDKLEGIGVPHIIIEMFRGNSQMIKLVESVTAKKVTPLERNGNSNYRRFPLKNKFYYYNRIAKRLDNSSTSFSICSDGDHVPFDLNSTINCCGTDKIDKLIPNSKFNMGNEKVATNVYNELRKKKIIGISEMDPYFSLSNDIFCQFWNTGSFEKYIPNCKWNNEHNTYKANKADEV